MAQIRWTSASDQFGLDGLEERLDRGVVPETSSGQAAQLPLPLMSDCEL
jgi:hypothetical protein